MVRCLREGREHTAGKKVGVQLIRQLPVLGGVLFLFVDAKNNSWKGRRVKERCPAGNLTLFATGDYRSVMGQRPLYAPYPSPWRETFVNITPHLFSRCILSWNQQKTCTGDSQLT